MQEAGAVTITRLRAHPAKQEAVAETDQHLANHGYPIPFSQRIPHIPHMPQRKQQGGVEDQPAWAVLDSGQAIPQIASENQFLVKGSDHAAIQQNTYRRQPFREIGWGEEQEKQEEGRGKRIASAPSVRQEINASASTWLILPLFFSIAHH